MTSKYNHASLTETTTTNHKFLDEGLEQVIKTPKYLFAIHNVETSTDLQS